MTPYIDSLYVDVQQKNLLSAQPPLFLNLQRPIHYYDPQHKAFSPNENHLVYHPIITPVSPPLTLKEESYPEEKKPLPRSRGRRVSSISNPGSRMFACKTDGCGKVFKRSEHLKRHVRSIHTLEKPFQCPYQSCHKRFSRSDNLNQHIRIHRHTAKETKKAILSPKCKLPYFNNNTTPYHNNSSSAYSNFI
ncbi:hypothetical protein BY458DRAFT_438030 [Sporodiniella umbellata]|nr:hypothetical protein BY458DRAFT_438030 [Sporodiniella umbellata]